jgi:hypothetical protein
MPIVNIKSDMDEISAGVMAESRQIVKAASKALNTAARGYKTDAGREMRKRYPLLRLKDLKDLFEFQFASPESLTVTIRVTGRALSLVRFLAGQVTKKGVGGVWVNVKNGRKFIPHAWVQTLKNKAGDDYQVIFVREGKGRLPVKVLKTINIPNALQISEVYDSLEKLIYERFDKEFSRQVNLL